MLRDIMDLFEQASQPGASVSVMQTLTEAILTNASRLSDASLAQLTDTLEQSGLPHGMLTWVERQARGANVPASERVLLLRHALKLYREAVAAGDPAPLDRVADDPAIARLIPTPGQNAPTHENPSATPVSDHIFNARFYAQRPDEEPNEEPNELDEPLLDGDEGQNDDYYNLTDDSAPYEPPRNGVRDDIDALRRLIANGPATRAPPPAPPPPPEDEETTALRRKIADLRASEEPEDWETADFLERQLDERAPVPDYPPPPPGAFFGEDADPVTIIRRQIQELRASGKPVDLEYADRMESMLDQAFPPPPPPDDAADPEAAAAVEGAENAEFSLAAVPPPPLLPTAPNSAAAFVAPLPGQGGTQGVEPIDAGNPPNASAAPPVQETIAEQAEAAETAAGGPEAVTGADALAASGVGNATDALTSPAAAAARQRLEGTTAPPGGQPGGAAAHLSTFFTPPPVTRDEAFVQEYAELHARRDLLARARNNPDTDEVTKARIDQNLVEIDARMDEIYEFMRKGEEPTPPSAQTAAFASPATAGFSPGSVGEGRLSTAAAYPASTRFVESSRRVGATPGLQSSPYSPEQKAIMREQAVLRRQQADRAKAQADRRRQSAGVGPASGQR
jgi:hypothetical protein